MNINCLSLFDIYTSENGAGFNLVNITVGNSEKFSYSSLFSIAYDSVTGIHLDLFWMRIL